MIQPSSPKVVITHNPPADVDLRAQPLRLSRLPILVPALVCAIAEQWHGHGKAVTLRGVLGLVCLSGASDNQFGLSG